MENSFNFIESKIAFIREFMNSTRPSSELEDFIKAFDTCKPNPIDDVMMQATPVDIPATIVSSIATAEEHHRPYNLIENEETMETPKKKRGFARKTVTINDGTKLNVHPASKMVKVSFFDRDTYYSSVTAAAQALGVSLNVVNRAAKKRTRINGHDVEYVNMNDLKTAPKKG